MLDQIHRYARHRTLGRATGFSLDCLDRFTHASVGRERPDFDVRALGGFRPPPTMTPLFHITLPSLDDNSPEAHFAPLVFALEGLIAIDMFHISRSLRRAERGMGPPVPPLYRSGVRYREDDAGREDWRDVFVILRRGFGDCDNLVSWRIAELRVAGIAAEPVIKWQFLSRDVAIALGYPGDKISPEGLWLVHCCVRHPSGFIEDPSKELGMGGGYTSRV